MKILASLACLAALTACGGPAVLEVTLKATDMMKYEGNSGMISMRMGETLKLTLENIGKMPKEGMGHNFVLLKPGTDVTKFSTAAATEKANDYIPASNKGDIVVHTKLLGPGESDTIEFKPTAAGDYPYLCSFPAHATMMKGMVRVK